MVRYYLRRAVDRITQIVYARRRFKLLLRTSLQDLDLRAQAVASATNFFSTIVHPVPIEAPFGDSMLVVAPHQDDEVIGCGGAMALQHQSGRALRAVILQDGADEHEQVSMTREALRDLRNEESRSAARLLGIDDPLCLGVKNLRECAESCAAALHEVIESRRIDVLFTPFVLDGHPDHRTCNAILAKALQDVQRPIRVFQYEVWAACIPNVVVIVDKVMEAKMEMLACFHFANSAQDYAHATKGLNMFHSRMLPAGRARFVEAYFEAPREEYLEMTNAVMVAERGK